MKYFIIAMAAVFLFSACGRSVRGNGHIITQKREVGSFDGVKASAGINVEITIGDESAVEVEADDNVMALINTRVVNNVLQIGYVDNTHLRNAHVTVKVSAASLNSISAVSSANVVVNGILKSSNTIKVKASSSAGIALEVDAPRIETEVSSSARIDIKGRTLLHKCEASSSGDILAAELLAEKAEAECSSSGTIKLHCSMALKARASSSGSITYRGNPADPDITKNSSGEVDKE